MTDHDADPELPATTPDPGPSKAHGDAFLDQSGSRQGHAHERSEAEEERRAEAEARES